MNDRVGTEPAASAPSPPAPTARAQTDTSFPRPVIVSILYLLNIVLGVSVFVGLILAYVWRSDVRFHATNDAGEMEASHHTYLIRTFWIGLLLWVLTGVAALVAIVGLGLGKDNSDAAAAAGILLGGGAVAVLLGLYTTVWFFARCIVSMVRSGNREPIRRPRTWWV